MAAEQAPNAGKDRAGSKQLRWTLSRVLVGTALVSLLIVGALNFVAARELLNDGARDRLVGVAQTRANSIDAGVEQTLSRVSATAADLAVIEALNEFGAAFGELDGEALDPPEEDELEDFYRQRVVEPLATLNIEVSVEDVAPSTAAGRYLQYHYSLPARTEGTIGSDDDSAYRSADERFGSFFVDLVAGPFIDDALLITPSGDIVYSASKSIDLGTSLATGPHRDTLLAEAVLDDLPRVRIGEAVLADFEIYVPNRGQSTLFAVAAVKDETEVVGSLALSISVDGLNAITTVNGDWEGIGLGDGEAYIVGPDRVLFSESRTWIEDPEGYVDSIEDPQLAGLIEALGSPVGVQPVDTEAVRAAEDGETFVGSTENYLGDDTYAYATQISVGGSKWTVVAEQPMSEVRSPLFDYLIRLGIVLAVVLPLAALIGYFLADRLTRSIPPVVEMASAIVGGERDLEAPDLGANEFGDLAMRLDQRATELGRQEAALEAEFDQRRTLLLSVLPPRLVQGEGELGGTGETIDTATVISIDVAIDGTASDEVEASELLRRFGQAAEAGATALDVERVRSAADRLLFLAGAERDDDGADAALEMAVALADATSSIVGSDDESLVLHVGMSTGPVATGVLERGSLTYTVWGEPVRRAMAIGALSTSNEILVDESTALAVTERSAVERASEVIALDGEPMTLFTPAATS